MAQISSYEFVGKMSPYPTVVQVTVAQYKLTRYLDIRPSFSRWFTVTQFLLEYMFPKDAVYQKQPTTWIMKTRVIKVIISC